MSGKKRNANRKIPIRPLHISVVVGLIAGAFTFLAHGHPAFTDSLAMTLERKLLDTKFGIRGRIDVEPAVVIAAGDEKTIERFGAWGMWDREVFARVITNLFAAGADVVAFDMVFSDKTGIGVQRAEALEGLVGDEPIADRLTSALRSNDHDALQRLTAQMSALETEVKEARSGTSKLVAAIEEHSSRTVLGFIAKTRKEADDVSSSRADTDFESLKGFGYTEYGLGYEIARYDEGAGEQTVVQIKKPENAKVSDLTLVDGIEGGFVAPLPELLDAAEAVGAFNADPDPDGTLRALPMAFRFGDTLLPTLSLQAAAQHFGASPLFLADPAFPEGLHSIGFPAEQGKVVIVPVDHRGRVQINYYGPSQAYDEKDPPAHRGIFRRVPIVDIYDNTFDAAHVRGRIVVVAVSAIGTYDQRVTPFSPFVPGVEVHAAALQNMIRGDALRRPGLFMQIELLLSVLLALVLGLVLPRLPIAAGIGVAVGLSFGYALVDSLLLFRGAMWFHQVPLQMQMWISWAGITVLGYLTEGREKAQLKREFSTVLAPTVVEQLLQNPELAGLSGVERKLTVMFSDIRGFTSMSEKLTPEGLTSFLNEYLTPMTDILIERQGTLDKYMGDAIMAFWGAPIVQEDHAVRACLASLDMIERLTALRARWRVEGKPDIDIGIGLNSGLMRVGFMGSERMRNYTVLGDNVNLGSRLEGLNKAYGTNIIISETTFEAAKSEVFARVIDAVRVKGKREPVTIYELRGRGRPAPDEAAFLDAFAHALALYQEQKFTAALLEFRALADAGDKTSAVYVERCEHFVSEPPAADWDGVFEMKTK
jgi:adenylate cyclase